MDSCDEGKCDVDVQLRCVIYFFSTAFLGIWGLHLPVIRFFP